MVFFTTPIVHTENWREHLQDYVEFLQTKYSLQEEDIRQELLAAKIPASIYATQNTPLQATTKYLHETLKYSVQEIAQALARTPAEIQQTLSKAKETLPQASGPEISTAIFTDRTLSISEHLVEELQRQQHSINEIAQLLNKNSQTIYTLRNRAETKRGESQ